MMNVDYTEEGNCYLITNFSDSNNPMFTCMEEIEDFKKRVFDHLLQIAEILAFGFHTDHYQLVLVLKSRKEFEDFYRQKKRVPDLDSAEIPQSTYILSQEIANICSGYAKMFNSKHQRFGSLFGRRYTKILLESSLEVEEVVQGVNEGKVKWDFDRLWSFIYNFLGRNMGMEKMIETSRWLYDGLGDSVLAGFLHYRQWYLRGPYIPLRLKC